MRVQWTVFVFPPDNFNPPSPIIVSKPYSVLDNKLRQEAFVQRFYYILNGSSGIDK